MEQIKHILPLAFLCFLFSFQSYGQSPSDTIEQKIISALSEGRVVDQLNSSFSKQPKGEFVLAPPNKDLRFGLLIYNIDIYPEKAEFSAGLAFRDPKSNQLIAFRADHIAFSNTNGLTGPVKLYLISDVAMNLGQTASIIIQKGLNETYAVIACNGLQEFAISGIVSFKSDFLLPVDANGEIMQGKELAADFSVKAKAWSDLLVRISIEPFQVKGLKNYIFRISEATMDLSESLNAESMRFPQAYQEQGIFEQGTNIWEGFYLKNGSVIFPGHFKASNGQRVELGVSNLLIDEFGFSGNVFGRNLLDFDKGRIANWNFSIDHAEIELVMNEIVSGKLAGDIGMPILPDTSRLAYMAYVGIDDHYGIQVSLKDNLTIPAFKVASVELASNSYIDMEIQDGVLSLQAELNGEMFIKNNGKESNKGPAFNFPSVAFQGFRVATFEPEIDIAYLGLKRASATSGFSKYPLCINDIYLQKSGGEKRIGIRFGLNLMEKLAVKAGIMIVAETEQGKLKFKQLQINEIEVKSVTSCFTLEGRIYFIKEDPNYGNGFSGNIKFTIDKPKIEASASVMFGNVNSHRYWYFDASVVWDKPGIPFFTGAEINGFLGGAWHGMREVNENDRILNPQYGQTSIGKRYVPDVKAGLGLRAGVYIRSTGGSGSSSPFLAKIALELQFNASGGINKISLFGNVDVMTENNKTDKTDLKRSTSNIPEGNAWASYKTAYQPIGKIGGPFMMEFDFSNKVYQANFAIYIQGIAGDKLSGIGHKGLAGEVSIYFSSDKWYFWVGTPQQPIGVRLSLGSAGHAEVSAYFMAGKEVKPAEPLPVEITNLLGERHADEMRRLNEMASGNAFAFGSRLMLQIGSSGGEKNVSIHASLKAIVGFDINVADYGKNTHCNGHTGPPGINGWFANGQLFVFLQGVVGANYKMGKIKGKIDLLTLTCAAQLYCQGPNPFYSSGSAALQVSIAGVVDKKMSLDFELGEQCEMKTDKLTDTSLIVEVSPKDGESNIGTLSPVIVRFSVPIDRPFNDREGRKMVFRLSQFTISEGEKTIPGKIVWNDWQDQLTFYSQSMLPGKKKMKIKVYVEAAYVNASFELVSKDGKGVKVLIGNDSRYQSAIRKMTDGRMKEMDFDNHSKIVCKETFEPFMLDNRKVDEMKEAYFTTAANPNLIPAANLEYAYPVPNQLNYYRSESNKGFVQLVVGQEYLTDVAGSRLKALFADHNGIVISECHVLRVGKRLQYNIPNQLLRNNMVYSLLIKRCDVNSPSELGKNLNSSGSQTGNMQASFAMTGNGGSNQNGGMEIKSKVPELVLLSFHFGVSGYLSFKEKMSDAALVKVEGSEEGSMDFRLSTGKNEYFDFFEMKNQPHLKPLLGYNLKLNQMSWFSNEAKKLYTVFNIKDAAILKYIQLERDTTVYGFYPYKTVALTLNNVEQRKLKVAANGLSAVRTSFQEKHILLESILIRIVAEDMSAIRKGLIACIASGEKINVAELNRYIALMNSDQSLNVSGAMKAAGMPTGSNTMAIGSQTGMVLSSPPYPAFVSIQGISNRDIPDRIAIQNTEMMLKISRLKIRPINNHSDFVAELKYCLPGETKPVSTCIIRNVKK